MEEQKGISRRGFLRAAAVVSAALTVSPAYEKVMAATSAGVNKKSSDNAGMAAVSTQRTLGKGNAAFTVSALGLGVMGMTYNRSQHPDKKTCIRLLHEAVDRGVTLFDTAIIYGPLSNELLAGEALSDYKNKVNVTTKFGHEVIDGKGTGRQDSRPATIRRYCEESLKRLRLDSIPMFYQHRFDPKVSAEEVAATIADLIKEGKVQRWGMCEVSAETIRKAHAVCPLTAIQSEYHLMHRLVEENDVLNTCRELGIGFVPYSPINRGFLGGCINEYTQFDLNNDNRQTLPRFQPDAMRANTRIVNVLQDFGRTRGMTSSQVALGWLLQKAPWVVPIPGTTKLAHLEENLRTLEFTCTAEEWKELENAVAAIPVVGDRYNSEQQKQIGH
ncbi:aldo/keto reductase [uncultured Bacteroides sp.]|uniref:aldo/keto reductase n=1 Tax=uncultured Bacteroides sp. TaxID=162156 RepID=UPI0025FF7D65|nr:aldo/keto reductase [uncultured Bacteroides sp.]